MDVQEVLFELDWAEIAQERVQPLAIVPHLDVLKEGDAGFIVRRKAAMSTLRLQETRQNQGLRAG